MIGIPLTADIQGGGNNAGIDNYLVHLHHLENHTQAQSTYEVHSYHKPAGLFRMLCSAFPKSVDMEIKSH